MAKAEVFLQLGAADVQVAVLHPHALPHPLPLLQGEGEGFGPGEQFDLPRRQFDGAGLQLGVVGLLPADADVPPHGDDRLALQPVGHCKARGAEVAGVKDHL